MPEGLVTLLSILFVAFFFGFSIFIHELGHMLAALWRGLHVDKFSIGFGHRILSMRKWNIDFIIGWLPLGGYVALPQMDATGEPKTEKGEPLPEAKPMDRIITAFAGPLFNIIFALFLGTIIYFMGKPVTPDAEGYVVADIPKTSVEYSQGLKAGDIIRKINGKDAVNHQATFMEYVMTDDVTLMVDRGGQELVKIGPFTPATDPNYDFRMMPYKFEFLYDAKLGHIGEGTPAAEAGLESGDMILSVDDVKIDYFYQLGDELNKDDRESFKVRYSRDGQESEVTITPKVQSVKYAGMIIRNFPEVMELKDEFPAAVAGIQAGDIIEKMNGYPVSGLKSFKEMLKGNHDKEINLSVRRGGQALEFKFTPRYDRKILGVGIYREMRAISPIQQVMDVVRNTFDTLAALISPNSGVGLDKMSSVVGISTTMYKVVKDKEGLAIVRGLEFVLMLNVALALFNLFPLPVLDGGHIVIALLEQISKRKVPIRVLQPIYTCFVIMLLTFMCYAIFNDVKREVDTRELVQVEQALDKDTF